MSNAQILDHRTKQPIDITKDEHIVIPSLGKTSGPLYIRVHSNIDPSIWITHPGEDAETWTLSDDRTSYYVRGSAERPVAHIRNRYMPYTVMPVASAQRSSAQNPYGNQQYAASATLIQSGGQGRGSTPSGSRTNLAIPKSNLGGAWTPRQQSASATNLTLPQTYGLTQNTARRPSASSQQSGRTAIFDNPTRSRQDLQAGLEEFLHPNRSRQTLPTSRQGSRLSLSQGASGQTARQPSPLRQDSGDANRSADDRTGRKREWLRQKIRHPFTRSGAH
ncbi:hypothetical protein EMMF5_005662 [Cystobasidiomycetes sp. EMM_F5]